MQLSTTNSKHSPNLPNFSAATLIVSNYQHNHKKLCGRSAVAERSKASVLDRRWGRLWVRRRNKSSFFCGVEESNERISMEICEFAIFWRTRGCLNQPSSRGIAIYHCLSNNVCIGMNKGFRWPEKRIPAMGVPHLKKKKLCDLVHKIIDMQQFSL